MHRVAVILDAGAEDFQTARSEVEGLLRDSALEYRILPVHMGGRRAWSRFNSKEGVVSRNDFSHGKPMSEAVDGFCAWPCDALVALPSEGGDILNHIVKESKAALKLGRKEVLGELADIGIGTPGGETAAPQTLVLKQALHVLKSLIWK